MNDLQDRWNARWRDKAVSEPWQADLWLQRVLPLLEQGQTLDVACGSGRNAIFLAEHHCSVTAVDISDEALVQLSREATARNLLIKTRQVDLEGTPNLPRGPFDQVIVFFYLHRPLVTHLKKLVRPGGLFVMRTFSSAGSFPAGTIAPEFVLQPGELLELFRGWEMLFHEEGVEPSTKGGSLAGIVARRLDSS